MITRIEALNYRSLHYINQELRPFQVLIGPNASGKTTFLDVLMLLSEVINAPNLGEVIQQRVPDFRDMTWMRQGDWIEFGIEAAIPSKIKSPYRYIRYEVRLGVNPQTDEMAWLHEVLWGLDDKNEVESDDHNIISNGLHVPERITYNGQAKIPNGWHKIASKSTDGNDVNYMEILELSTPLQFFSRYSRYPILGFLPEDEDTFAAATWFKQLLSDQIQRIMLNSEALRKPSPPQSPRTFLPDGSNLPHIIHELERNHPNQLKKWVEHIQTALPDVRLIATVERPEDRHRYLKITYENGVEVPSWAVSDGTLRLLALTILAYLPDMQGIYLIEEPENGIHPRAVETVLQSLSSVYDGQVLIATHSPTILGLIEPHQMLIFNKNEQGETSIISGDLHTDLQNWKNDMSLSTLFAAGVLG